MDNTVLTYDREKVVELLKARLVEEDNKRAAANQKKIDRNKATVEQLNELIEKSSDSFLVRIVAALNQEFGIAPGTPEFATWVANHYPGDNDIEADRQLKQLIRIYENAADAQVKISVNDETYRYL